MMLPWKPLLPPVAVVPGAMNSDDESASSPVSFTLFNMWNIFNLLQCWFHPFPIIPCASFFGTMVFLLFTFVILASETLYVVKRHLWKVAEGR